MITNHMFWINKELHIMFLKQENDCMKFVVFNFMKIFETLKSTSIVLKF